MRDFSWDDARIFAEVAAAGSWKRGAAKLGISTATASRRVDAFERWVGEKLLERRPDAPRLTPRGQVVMQSLAGMTAAADSIRRQAAAPVAQTVRITATASMGLVLLAGLRELAAAAPAAVISLLPTRAALSLARREAEIAIRMRSPPVEGRLVVRRLARVRLAIYASPALVPDGALADPATLPFIGLARQADRSVSAAALHALVGERPAVAVLDDTPMRLAACKAGLGIALLPCLPAEAAGLRRIAALPETTDEDAYLLMHEDLVAQPAVRMVADAVSALFARSRAALLGDA